MLRFFDGDFQVFEVTARQRELVAQNAVKVLRRQGLWDQGVRFGITDPFNLVMERVESPTVAICNGKPTILLGTYNYMGMTFDPDVIAAGKKALDFPPRLQQPELPHRVDLRSRLPP